MVGFLFNSYTLLGAEVEKKFYYMEYKTEPGKIVEEIWRIEKFL